MCRSSCVAIVVFCMHAAPWSAAADWLLTPYIGGSLFDVPDTGFRPNVGGSIVWSGPVLGVELDANATPEFLKDLNGAVPDSSGLLSVMANAIVQFPTRPSRLRPYAAAGAGLIRTTMTIADGALDSSRTRAGFNAGGGLTGLISPRVGVRGDVRYFRAAQGVEAAAGSESPALDPLHFVRVTLGVTCRF